MIFGLELPFWLMSVFGGFKSVFRFFTTKPGVYILIAMLIGVGIWYVNDSAYNRGVFSEKMRNDLATAHATAEAFKRGLEIQKQLDAGAIAAADRAGFLRGQSQIRTITLTKEVTKYVSSDTDRLFALPCGLLRLHNAAALEQAPEDLPNPAGLADGEACPVEPSDFARVIVGNYGLYYQAVGQIIGLQDLSRTLAATITSISEEGGSLANHPD